MKVNFRSRKLVLFGENKLQSKPSEAPIRFPPNRVILRRHAKEPKEDEDLPKQTPNQSVKEASEKDDSMETETPYKIFRQHYGDYDPPTEYLQARDRRTILRYEFREKSFDLEAEKEKLNEWLGEMHFKVVSSSFNLYLTNELTFQQVKVHCCENLLLNILNFLENLTQSSQTPINSRSRRAGLSYLQLSEILKHMNQTLQKNLAYMQIKYPLTKDTKPNKSLQSLISKINNLGNDEHDLIMKSKVDFKLKKEDNYTPEIMKFLNFIITKQAQLCKVRSRNNKRELTYFEYFYETIQRIFTSVYKPEYETKEKVDSQRELAENPALIFAKIMSQNVIDEEEDESTKTKEAKQYKEKVMKYTHYLIGQKFSSNTETYTDQEIQTQIFDVKNSSILRVLTKWTEELEKKILQAEQEILKRPFRFKKNKEFEFSKLSANQKNDLFQQTKRRAKEVNAFNEQLKENYNEIEAMLSCHLQQQTSMKHIPKNEYKVGYFCSKIQAAASSTLLSYLNKIIHILLQIPEQLKKNHEVDQQYVENMDINLITFKIADLFRCKIKSREAQIVRIFKEIKRISEKGEPFKIVRIKDRLNLGTRDILINVIFMNIFLCEIQLAVEDYVQSKQMSFDSFSHFLYELKRSRLGPIMESACTWAQFDQRSKIFRAIVEDKYKDSCKFVPHSCGKSYFINNKYPFVCSLCQKFYSTQEGLVQHRKCNLCKTYYECSLCIFSKMSPKEVSKLIGLQTKLGMFIDDFALWNFTQNNTEFPKFGLLTSKKMKKPNIAFFQTVVFKYDAYIIKTLDNAEIEIIHKISNNSTKIWRKISETYIIYEWKEKRAINTTITPAAILQALEQEKKIRDQNIKAKKQEKQRKRAELEAKRKEEEQRRKTYFDKDKEEKDKNKPEKEEQCCSESEQQNEKREKKKNAEENKITARYHEKITKKNEQFKSRVIIKTDGQFSDILVLNTFLSESVIRNKLKEMNNKNILQKLSTQKIEVLFLQDQYIHNEINAVDNLSEADLAELKQTLQRVSEIYFDNNFIEDLEFFSTMVNLRVAHLSHNKIEYLDKIENLKHLNELILQNNKISDLSCLKNKLELVQLNLNRNQIYDLTAFSNIEDGDFCKLRNFYINDNQLQSMEGLQKLTNLVKLDLSYNKIKEICPITTLVHLEELDLSLNMLTNLSGIENYKNLKKLILNKNQIRIMSKELQSLESLNVLEMASNKIKRIKNINTGQISKSLKVLNLSNNLIQKIEGLDCLENLQMLNLSHNEIQSIGNNYLDFANLIKWDLSYNCIEELAIEDVEQYMPCLKELHLNSNPINLSDFNRGVVANLTKLFGKFTVQYKGESFYTE